MNLNTGIPPTDKQLIDRILRGNNQAFGIVVKNTEALIAQIVFKFIPHPEDRKDLVQDIYLKVFHHLSGFQFKSKLSTWIAQIAYNTCISWVEKKKLILPGLLPEDLDESNTVRENDNDPEYLLMQKEISAILTEEIKKLPPVYQTLISLFHQEQMSYIELAQITGLREGTVKSSLFRARKLLKETLLNKYQKEAL